MSYRCPLCNVILGAPGNHFKKHNMSKSEYYDLVKAKSPDAVASFKEQISYNITRSESITARRVRK